MAKRQEATRRKAKAEESKNRIYETALAVIGEKGYEATTILDITARAGVAIGTFYHYFHSKNGILEENFGRADEAFASFAASPALREGTAEERILLYLDRYALLIEETGIDLIKQLYTSRNKLFIRRGRAMQEGLTALLAEAQGRGELKAEPGPEGICDYLFIAARGVVFHWCLLDGERPIRELMREHFAPLIPIFLR
jgi:AcrR family transcriptional regulator